MRPIIQAALALALVAGAAGTASAQRYDELPCAELQAGQLKPAVHDHLTGEPSALLFSFWRMPWAALPLVRRAALRGPKRHTADDRDAKKAWASNACADIMTVHGA